MFRQYKSNPTRYYLLIVFFLAFLFFSNDFGLIDTQKTAIVTAVGIDREDEEFILTSQVAIPQPSTQGTSTQAVQLVSRGKTVSEAFEQINAKTGWYPKLVFCKLLVLGKKTAEDNVFDALDFFLLDEYLSDDCLVAVCEGLAKEILDVSALVDATSSLAIEKVLSDHAERVGAVRPAALKDFSIGYFSENSSGLLPVLKKEKQQEEVPSQNASTSNPSENNEKESANPQNTEQQEKNKPVFSAKETALFVHGRWRDTLTPAETFAVNATIGKLRLASYSVPVGKATCTLSVKHNDSKIKIEIGKEGQGQITALLTLTAGLLDYSQALDLEQLGDGGDVPYGVFASAEKKLSAEVASAYEKAKAVGCDLFGIKERFVKYKNRKYHKEGDSFFEKAPFIVKVRFENIR